MLTKLCDHAEQQFGCEACAMHAMGVTPTAKAFAISSSAATGDCPHLGNLVTLANCGCPDRHEYQCLCDDAPWDTCTKSANNSDGRIGGCVGCPLRPGRNAATTHTSTDARPRKPIDVQACVITYPGEAAALNGAMQSWADSDWGETPIVHRQPEDAQGDSWAKTRDNWFSAMTHLLKQPTHQHYLVCEGDVRAHPRIREALEFWQALETTEFASLYLPDIIEQGKLYKRYEPERRYAVAHPSKMNGSWPDGRLWGSQAYLMSRWFLETCVKLWRDARWDNHGQRPNGQDARVLNIAKTLGMPFAFHSPDLVEHSPTVTAFGTPTHKSASFDAECLEPLPLDVPGWFSAAECLMLRRLCRGKHVLELGRHHGRSTVCIAQSCAWLDSVDLQSPDEADKHMARYGVGEGVRLLQCDVSQSPARENGYDVIFIDTEHDSASVTRDIRIALGRLKDGGVLAFHDYGEKNWPDVDKVVNEHRDRLGWVEVGRAGMLGAFTVRSPRGAS